MIQDPGGKDREPSATAAGVHQAFRSARKASRTCTAGSTLVMKAKRPSELPLTPKVMSTPGSKAIFPEASPEISNPQHTARNRLFPSLGNATFNWFPEVSMKPKSDTRVLGFW